MTIHLSSGYDVALDSFYSERTYAGLLEGLPDAAMNAEILVHAQSHMTPLWGQRATHVMSPETRHVQGRSIFPAMTYFAWLTSRTPIDKGYDGSELVVVWFAPEKLDLPLSAIIGEAIRELPWADLAKDFSI